jgi:hypothetical protein
MARSTAVGHDAVAVCRRQSLILCSSSQATTANTSGQTHCAAATVCRDSNASWCNDGRNRAPLRNNTPAMCVPATKLVRQMDKAATLFGSVGADNASKTGRAEPPSNTSSVRLPASLMKRAHTDGNSSWCRTDVYSKCTQQQQRQQDDPTLAGYRKAPPSYAAQEKVGEAKVRQAQAVPTGQTSKPAQEDPYELGNTSIKRNTASDSPLGRARPQTGPLAARLHCTLSERVQPARHIHQLKNKGKGR